MPANKTIILNHFFPRFLGWTLVLQLLVWLASREPAVAAPVELAIAGFAGEFYRLFFGDILISANQLIHEGSGAYVVVDQECTALALVATVWAGIFSLSHSLKKKIMMAIIAIAVIQLENAFRIMHLYYEIGKVINRFEFYHLYVWQLINFITAVCVFFFLDKAFQKKEFNLGLP
ncbi:exosortase/archaeosortase family protein [Thalassomonas viridans]|uniref:Exosortase/archaeosortase family protein n=1 Tax=Thalassomonas viridans TaxID=137584 RepID=A0AAF0C8U9_9GAMM|nr:exosortase/archaeosortase family protein [Thalassomonas viridans]WDE05128.1 exosortase/archaeosortase family protein [Thalassomonas viridans]